jgi:hypothetical protein
MQKRYLRGLTLALAAGAALHAQSITTGSVRGTIADAKGAPLAGARVTLASSQITRTIVTGADGSFRAGLLNPGTWVVTVSLGNYQTQTSRVLVSPNDNRALNFKLSPVAAATVVVSAAAQVVDTTSVSTGENISLDQVAAIPKGRDFTSLAYFTPGVATNGFVGHDNSPSMSGASGAENTYYVDGLDTTDYRYGFQGAQLKTDFIDQVAVQTGGFAPEYSALGGVFNAITKSGSNDFKGSAWATWDAAGIHAKLKRNKDFTEPNLNADTRYDTGVEVSGPIIKDELFYFIGVDSENRKGLSTSNFSGLRNDQPTDDTLQTVAKINWFITPDMQLTWFNNYNREKFDTGANYNGSDSNYGNQKAGYSQTNTTTSSNMTFDWTMTPSLTMSLKGGFFQLDSKQNPMDSQDSQVADLYWYEPTGGGPNAALAGTAFDTGGFGTITNDEKNKTTQFDGSLTWIVGNHMIKGGASYLKSEYSLDQMGSGDGFYYTIASDLSSLSATEFVNLPATVTAYYKALYLQDNWKVVPGFRLIYGFRYEGQSQDDYQGRQIFNFSKLSDSTQPRFGFTWDVHNDGTTKVSGSWARYYEHFPQRAAIRTWGRETYITRLYTNYGVNWKYDPASPTHFDILGPYDGTHDYSTAFNQDPLAKGIKLPQRDEFMLGVDHQFGSGWTLGLHGVHRELKNAVEDSVITDANGNPISADGHAIWWNPGSSVTWTQGSVSSDAGTTYSVPNTGFPKAYNRYDAVTFSADKRDDRNYISFNYTWSHLRGNYEGVVTSSNAQSDGNITASFDQTPYVGTGDLPLDRKNAIKLQASHRFDFYGGALNLGANWTLQTGTPISLFDDGSTTNGYAPGYDSTWNLGNGQVANDPTTYANYNNNANWSSGTVGTGNYTGPTLHTHKWLDSGDYGNAIPANGRYGQYGRTPTTSQVDMHMDWTRKVGSRYRIIPSVDIFNLFNARTATSIYQNATFQNPAGAPDPRYGEANAWQEGRRYHFGLKFQF